MTTWAVPALVLGVIRDGLPDLEEAFGYGVYRETPTDADFEVRMTALPIVFGW